MNGNAQIRWGWLRFMYIYTIVGAGGFGLGMIFMPNVVQSFFRFPPQDAVVFGITAGVYTAFALMSVLGLKSPLKFAPVLLLQLLYKTIWLAGVVLPLFISGRFPLYAIPLVVIFATYIIGDLIAIPFSQLLSREPARENRRAAEPDAA